MNSFMHKVRSIKEIINPSPQEKLKHGEAEKNYAEIKEAGQLISDNAKHLLDEIKMLNGGAEDLWFGREDDKCEK